MKIIFIVLILVLGSPLYGQFWRKDKKEDNIKKQAIEDVKALPSEEHFPYIEKFHEAVREKFSGNYSKAKKLFNECLELYPYDDAVYFGLAEVAKKQQLKSEALRYYKKAQEADPKNIHYTKEIAFLQFEKADFKDAAKSFEQLIEKEPRRVEWLYAYAQTLVYNRDYKKALEIFDKLQDQTGPIFEVTMIKVDLYRELKKIDKVEEELLMLKKAFPQNLEVLKTVIGFYEDEGKKEKAFELIKELVEAEPNNGIANFILAKRYIEEGNKTSFLKAFRAVAASNEVKLEDKIMLIQPIFSFEAEYDQEIVAISEIMVETHPNESKILAFHAEVLSNLGRSKEALTFYRKALQNNTSEFRLWTSVLAFQSSYREYEALYEDGKEAISYFPSLPFIYYAAAEGALYVNRLDEAMDLLSAGSMYIIDDNTQEARFLMRFAEVYFAKGDIQKGVEYFEKALKKDPKSTIINTSYAYQLAKAEKHLEKANQLIEPLLDQKEKNTRTYYTIAFVLLKNNQYEEAVAVLEKGINNSLFKGELYDLLGDVYIKMNENNKAIETWKKAKSNESRNKMIDKKIDEQQYYAPKFY